MILTLGVMGLIILLANTSLLLVGLTTRGSVSFVISTNFPCLALSMAFLYWAIRLAFLLIVLLKPFSWAESHWLS